ncbi:MAG: SDR family oxidoreductase [Chloroflexota bacterium]
MDNLLADKVIFVTGAGRGLGSGVARGLAQLGAKLCITDVNENELAQTLDEIQRDGNDALTLTADVCDFAQMQSAVDVTVQQWGRLDMMVNNAAIMPLVPFTETTPELWQTIIDINLTGVYNGSKAAWPQMVKQGGGHCVAIASGASVRGFVDEVAYCTAKHGLEGFTKALAIEAKAANIGVNTMGPGKRIKPTSISRAEAENLSADQLAKWADPATLAPAFGWLALQPPTRYTGLRFDAGPLADTVTTEGYNFEFAPEKVTLYVEEFRTRLMGKI